MERILPSHLEGGVRMRGRAMEEVGKRSYTHEGTRFGATVGVLAAPTESVAIIHQKSVAIIQTNKIHALLQSHYLTTS